MSRDLLDLEISEQLLKEELNKAQSLLIEIYEIMKSQSGDPYDECPFCMGELFDREEEAYIRNLQKSRSVNK